MAGAGAVNGIVRAATVIATAKAAEAMEPPPIVRIPLPPDPIKEYERLAGERAKAMNNVRNGNYRIAIRHSLGYVHIEDHEFRTKEEGLLVGAEAYEVAGKTATQAPPGEGLRRSILLKE